MRISIAMCMYNGAQYLQQQLDSFASQTYLPCELVVCDDGSTDATLSVIERFTQKASFPIRIFENERNLGSTKNFEKAIGLCKGDLIALSDQDDVWYPDKLAEFHHLFEEFPEAVAALGDADLIDEHSVLLGRSLWNSVYFSLAGEKAYKAHMDAGIVSILFRHNIATGATMVFRAQLRNEFIPIPDSWVHDGWIAWVAALQAGLAVLPGARMRYRIHPRQQVGLNPPSIAARVAIARRDGLLPYASLINQFQALRRYLEEHQQCSQFAKFIPGVDAKIRHIQGRAALAESPLHVRVRWILSSWQEYQRYARGPISMLKDIFLISRTPNNE